MEPGTKNNALTYMPDQSYLGLHTLFGAGPFLKTLFVVLAKADPVYSAALMFSVSRDCLTLDGISITDQSA